MKKKMLTEDLQDLYQSIITGPNFLKNLVKQSNYEDWIRINPVESKSKHIESLKALKEKLIELELYEYIQPVDDHILELQEEIEK